VTVSFVVSNKKEMLFTHGWRHSVVVSALASINVVNRH